MTIHSVIMRFSLLLAVALAILAPYVCAAPTPVEARQSPPLIGPALGILCSLPIISDFICKRQAGDVLIKTPLGIARGFQATSTVSRFAVRYAAASRWQPSFVVPLWTIPENNVTALPRMCPQPDADESTFSEDCLFLVMYVPTAPTTTRLPVTVWIHGGSFLVGSATGPGMDASNLAQATNSIVVTIQYRLGVLGFLPPSAQGGNRNLAIGDVMNALNFLRTVAPSFKGDRDKITVIGHSSGANMVRALLATPGAQPLFHKAVMQSDPVNFGFLTPTAQDAMRDWYYSRLPCGASDFACQSALPVSTLLPVQGDLVANAVNIDPAAGSAQPLRPVKDDAVVTASLTGSSWPSSLGKPLLLTTVKDEAGAPIYGAFSSALPPDAFFPITSASMGAARAQAIVDSGRYAFTPELSRLADGDDTRRALEALGTDYVWRCAGWTLARAYAAAGGRVWVAEWQEGATYPPNEAVSFCAAGAVCHQDELFPVFGTTPAPTPAQAALTSMIQARYKAFIYNSDPNPADGSLPAWDPATSTDVRTIQFGGSGGLAPVAQCEPDFWGSAIQYDYQVFGL